MSRQDFIPRTDANFDAFMRFIVQYCDERRVEWGHLSAADVQALDMAYDQWRQAYLPTLEPHIPQLTAEKNRVRLITERTLRAFINRFLRWPPVTDLDRDKMGIRNHDTIRTPQPAPATVPEMEFVTSVIRQITIRFRDFGATNWGKPEHVHAIEICWAILDSRPDSVAALIHNETDTASPHMLEFDESERGRRVFVAARWENNTAQAGPWSDIESAVIP